jgi:hypothetical protein
VARYRTPRKKTTNWKGVIGAAAIGAVLAVLGILLLSNLPDPGEAGVESELSEVAMDDGKPTDVDAEEREGDTSPLDDGSPPTAAQTRVSGVILGMGLVLLGLVLPVGVYVIDRTSGKKWSRRAGKKHPWKRKI